MLAPATGNTAQVWAAQRVIFSRKEVALLLNLSLSQIKRLIRDERLRVKRVGRRVLIHREEVIRFTANTLPYCGLRT